MNGFFKTDSFIYRKNLPFYLRVKYILCISINEWKIYGIIVLLYFCNILNVIVAVIYLQTLLTNTLKTIEVFRLDMVHLRWTDRLA